MSGDAPPRIRLYVSAFCALCDQARRLLVEHRLEFEEIDIGGAEACCELRERTGGASVPQVTLDGRALGGYEELTAFVGDARLPQGP